MEKMLIRKLPNYKIETGTENKTLFVKEKSGQETQIYLCIVAKFLKSLI